MNKGEKPETKDGIRAETESKDRQGHKDSKQGQIDRRASSDKDRETRGQRQTRQKDNGNKEGQRDRD